MGQPRRGGRPRVGRPRSAGRRPLVSRHARSDIRPWMPAGRLGLPDADHRRERGRAGSGDRAIPPPTRAGRAAQHDPATSRRRGATDRVDRRDASAARGDRAGRRDRFHRPARGRERCGQGTGRASDPRVEPAAQRTVRRDQLRGAGRDTTRGGAVRDRGTDGNRRPRPAGKVRGRRRRDAVSRRGLRPLRVGPGQAASRDSGSRRRARRRSRDPPGGHPDHRRDQPQPVVPGRAAAVSARSVLSPERRRHSGAHAARASPRHPGARPVLSRAPQNDAAAEAVGGSVRRAHELRLAGQCAGARAPDRARRRPGQRRPRPTRRPAADRPRRLCDDAGAVGAA